MKKTLAFLFIFLVLVVYHFIPCSVYAEAGLSEAGRTQYFKINDEIGISVLPASKSSNPKDNISFFKYKKNPEYDKLFGKLCNGRYITEENYDGVYFAHVDIYIQGSYVWGESEDEDSVESVVNIESGQVWDFERLELEEMGYPMDNLFEKINNGELIKITIFEDSQTEDKVTAEELRENFFIENGLSREKAKKFDLEYVEANYEILDMDNLQDFSCYIAGVMFVIYGIPALILLLVFLLVVIFVVKKIRKRKVN